MNAKHATLILAGTLGAPIYTWAATATSTAPSTSGSLFKVFLGLAAVLLVMAAITWALKRIVPGAGGQQSVIKVVGGVSVGTRERVVVVEVAGRWLVVGVAAGQVNAIANLDKATDSLNEALQNTSANTEAGLQGITQSLPPQFSTWLKKSKDKLVAHANAK
ncbi:MAG TPA: flagellar biosynthetic protein FliO [Methylophilaceae bacterium]|nr:flagellar biosynthetic protein FliO [Methylophilaceae bacterium]